MKIQQSVIRYSVRLSLGESAVDWTQQLKKDLHEVLISLKPVFCKYFGGDEFAQKPTNKPHFMTNGMFKRNYWAVKILPSNISFDFWVKLILRTLCLFKLIFIYKVKGHVPIQPCHIRATNQTYHWMTSSDRWTSDDVFQLIRSWWRPRLAAVLSQIIIDYRMKWCIPKTSRDNFDRVRKFSAIDEI